MVVDNRASPAIKKAIQKRRSASSVVMSANRTCDPSRLTYTFMVRCGSKNHDLFVAKSDHGIDLGGAACGDIAGNHRDQCEQEGNARKC